MEQAHISSHRCQIGLQHRLKHSQRVMHWNGQMKIEGEKESGKTPGSSSVESNRSWPRVTSKLKKVYGSYLEGK
ncbi:hypothetical protein J6590_100335 [Homalodisca vitripennis]|nr:hypothetical protein J6590_100335 [Homalodisca vitripennis]